VSVPKENAQTRVSRAFLGSKSASKDTTRTRASKQLVKTTSKVHSDLKIGLGKSPNFRKKKKGGNRIRKKNPESDQGKAVKADHSGDQIGQPPFLATFS
jgi:hypothetical protein